MLDANHKIAFLYEISKIHSLKEPQFEVNRKFRANPNIENFCRKSKHNKIKQKYNKFSVETNT